MISPNNIFKNTIIPFIGSKNKYYRYKNEENIINENKHPKSPKNISILFENKNLMKTKHRLFSTRNPTISSKLNKNIKSAMVKKPNINKSLFNSFNTKKDKMNNTGTSFRRNNEKNLKRTYSAYYIKGDLPLEKKYISDFLVKSNDLKYDKSKISDIEEKISKLGRSLNLFLLKNNSLHLSHSYSNIQNKKINKLKVNNDIDSKNNKNSIANSEEEKNDIEKEKDENILPDYLKDEFNIKGTNILSPFCIKARDSFTFQKFIRYFNEKTNLKSDRKYINNKLNIIYAENEDAYNMKITLLNKKLNEQGKIDKYQVGFPPTEKLLRNIEKKVTFMKKIIEYAYPNTALMRMRIPESKRYFQKYKYKYAFKKCINNEKYDEVHNDIFNFPSKSTKNKGCKKKFSKIILYK